MDIDLDNLRNYLENFGVIVCADVDERHVLLELLRSCGLPIGFDEEGASDRWLCISLGNADRSQIHASTRPMHNDPDFPPVRFKNLQASFGTLDEELVLPDLGELYAWAIGE